MRSFIVFSIVCFFLIQVAVANDTTISKDSNREWVIHEAPDTFSVLESWGTRISLQSYAWELKRLKYFDPKIEKRHVIKAALNGESLIEKKIIYEKSDWSWLWNSVMKEILRKIFLKRVLESKIAKYDDSNSSVNIVARWEDDFDWGILLIFIAILLIAVTRICISKNQEKKYRKPVIGVLSYFVSMIIYGVGINEILFPFSLYNEALFSFSLYSMVLFGIIAPAEVVPIIFFILIVLLVNNMIFKGDSNFDESAEKGLGIFWVAMSAIMVSLIPIAHQNSRFIPLALIMLLAGLLFKWSLDKIVKHQEEGQVEE